MYRSFVFGMLSIIIFISSCENGKSINTEEKIYLTSIREDFIKHKEDVTTINEINSKIVMRIDSLFQGSRKDTLNTDLIKGIMNTRSYTLTITAYKNILNGNYITNDELKIRIARHIAQFEGLAMSKRSWDAQWDMTARPYLYKYGLFSKPGITTEKKNLIADPEFKAVLWDRRMFAHDVEIWTPRILSSADSVITTIDVLLKS